MIKKFTYCEFMDFIKCICFILLGYFIVSNMNSTVQSNEEINQYKYV